MNGEATAHGVLDLVPVSVEPGSSRAASTRNALLSVASLALIVVLGLLDLTGCASADVMRIDTTPRAPRPIESVQLLLDEPTRPYTSIALIEVSDDGWGLSLEELRDKLTQEAAKIGGEAVVLTRRTSSSGTALMPVGNQWWGIDMAESQLIGKVIVYNAPPQE